MTKIGIIPQRTGTLAEHLDLMIDEMKKNGSQNSASYNAKHGIIILVLDNNRDANQGEDYEHFARIAKMAGFSMQRRKEDRYDWWISMITEPDPLKAAVVMSLYSAQDKDITK